MKKTPVGRWWRRGFSRRSGQGWIKTTSASPNLRHQAPNLPPPPFLHKASRAVFSLSHRWQVSPTRGRHAFAGRRRGSLVRASQPAGPLLGGCRGSGGGRRRCLSFARSSCPKEDSAHADLDDWRVKSWPEISRLGVPPRILFNEYDPLSSTLGTVQASKARIMETVVGMSKVSPPLRHPPPVVRPFFHSGFISVKSNAQHSLAVSGPGVIRWHCFAAAFMRRESPLLTTYWSEST